MGFMSCEPTRRRQRRAAVVSRAITCVVQPLEKRLMFTAYYVNSTAGTDGNGSAAAPWTHLYDVSNHTGFQSGDVVYLTGTFNNQTMSLSAADAGMTITSADPQQPATIDEYTSFGFVSAITVNCPGVTISHLNMIGPGITADSNSYYGIWFNNSTSTQYVGATVDHITESGFVFAGLEIQGTTAGFTNATVTNSSFDDNQVSGIVVQGPGTALVYVNYNLLISNCTTSGNAGAAIWWNSNNVGGNQNSDNGGIFVSALSTGIITHCTAIGNCYNSTGAVGIWTFNSTGVTIEYCESADTRTNIGSWDGCGFDFDKGTSDSIMEYDYSHGNEGSGFFICTYQGIAPCYADTIRDCISDDDGWSGRGSIELYSDAHAVEGANIYNNTILTISSSDGGFVVDGADAANCTANFLNNIIYNVNGTDVNTGSFTPSSSNLKLEGNDYWSIGTKTNFDIIWGSNRYYALNGSSGFITATGEETINGKQVGMNLDPLLNYESVTDLPIADIADFELSPSSPLFGTALNLASSPFNSSSPYTSYSPYNLDGTAYGGLGKQDYFGFSINDGGSQNVGADGSNRVNLSAGTMTVAPSVVAGINITTFSSVVLTGNADLLIPTAANQSARSLAIITNGLTLSGTNGAWTSTLDLGGNDLDVQNGNLATISSQVHQGWLNNWQGDGGIVSSLAASDPTHLTALGVIQNSITGSPTGAVLYGNFDTASAYDTDVLVKYTYYGDANLDGKVDGSDYSRIDNGAALHLTGWYNGDFNYDGIINGSDYTLIDNAYNTQGTSLAAQIAITRPPTPHATAATLSPRNQAPASAMLRFVTKCYVQDAGSIPEQSHHKQFKIKDLYQNGASPSHLRRNIRVRSSDSETTGATPNAFSDSVLSTQAEFANSLS